MAALEGLALWGGFECSVVRVGEGLRNQLGETGHDDRPDDLERVARLGVKTIRYPLLRETVSPERPDACDWSVADARFVRVRELGLTPVVGLVHHGSGPRYAALLDPGFAAGLAAHAGRVARRFPWIEHFTPVNEPLTTARFSALYGHWHPHQRDAGAFLRALLNQCAATRLAMKAIREATPGAKLVQTEDVGKAFSTPRLAYQAAYENERRWLSLDLLCGRVDRGHPFWPIFRAHGVAEAELAPFLDDPCSPDVIGVNHYLTSERYLDERSDLYPPYLRGGNGRDRYADAEAVRIATLAGETARPCATFPAIPRGRSRRSAAAPVIRSRASSARRGLSVRRSIAWGAAFMSRASRATRRKIWRDGFARRNPWRRAM
jgi:dTDP-4-dehydrorhamnose reductase